MAPSGQSRRMRPRDIRYTQDSIGSRFTDGTYLSGTFEQLLNRRISVDQVERIEVVEERSLYWALTGNRRLYLYQKLEDLGEVNTIPIHEMSLSNIGIRRRFDNRNTTACDGLEIEIRQSGAEWHFRSAIERWKASKTVNRNLNEGLGMYTSCHLPTEVSTDRADVALLDVEQNDVTLDVCNDDVNKVSCCGKRFVAYTAAIGLLLFLFALFVVYYMTMK